MSIFDAVRSLWNVRENRIVTCPETRLPVGIRTDARYVVTSCTRWPEKAGCDQACRAEVEASPQETLVKSIVSKWYRDRTCSFCGKAISEITGSAVVPALRRPDGTLREWRDVAPEKLPEMLETALAVCGRCELAESFRRDFPHLVTDRKETPLRNRAIY
jgi:hypothetical protein